MKLKDKIKTWLFKEETDKINNLCKYVNSLNYINNVKCECQNLEELHYFYDDDWWFIGCDVFTEDNHRKPFGKLMYCPDCGSVKVMNVDNKKGIKNE